MVRCRTRQTSGGPDGSHLTAGSKVFSQLPSAPASAQDKAYWNGFCEIESEPAFFNVMLKQFGVEGVKIHEVVSLDDEMLIFLPRPIYGLVFLFKWVEEDSNRQEQSCPGGVWFANQTINNACATVALLNIVNNIPNLEIGEHLRAFKEFTASFSPALRGDAIGNFEFIKGIHNSFARKMDMLNIDLLLKNEATSSTKDKKRKADADNSESGFHFIALMPIDGQLWKLDGLERQPMCLGGFKDDWLNRAKADIEGRMFHSEQAEFEFSILGLVRDPLLDLIPELVASIASIARLSACLDALKTDWRDFEMPFKDEDSFNTLTGPDHHYGVTEEALKDAEIPLLMARLCESGSVEEIAAKRQQLITAQAGLRKSISDEQRSNQSDEQRAASRKCDYGARVREFVRRVKTKRRCLQRLDGTGDSADN